MPFSLPRIGSVGLVAASLLFFGGCGTVARPAADQANTPPNPSSPSAMPQANDLRSALETIYLAARASVDEPTPDAFLRIAEVPSFTPEKETKLRETWNDEMSKNTLKSFVFEDPSKHEFVKVVEQGEWAGYYYLSDLTEADRLTVNLMRFHKVGGMWKVYMQQSVASEPYEADSGKTRAQAIEGIIAESDSLQKIVPEAN